MGRFHRNIMRAYIKMVLHFVYFIFSLYYAHWFIISRSLLWPIGIAIWVMWFWAVIFDDIRMILYDLDWIEIEKTGLSASRFGKKKMLFWSEIVEVTIRDGVGIGDNNISNTHAVFSKHQLPIELQSYLCSDFDPWLNTTEYLEFHAGTIMKKSIAGDLIAENCAFFSKALSLYTIRSLSVVSEERSVRFDYQAFFRKTRTARFHSFARVSRNFLWFWTVLASQWAITNHSELISRPVLICLWVVTIMTSIAFSCWRRRVITSIRTGLLSIKIK